MTKNLTRILVVTGVFSGAPSADAQCQTNGTDQQARLYSIPSGESFNNHDFPNRCLAASGSVVTLTVDVLADLGCNAADAVNNGNPPVSCDPPPFCCDTDPLDKWVTLTANGNPINGTTASEAPADGKFFKEWDYEDPNFPKSGRSYCIGGTFFFNSHTVYISASQWNAWLGSSGNLMWIRVTASPEVKRLYSYCCDIGISGCQSFCPNCAPETLSRISISYVECVTDTDCPAGTFCCSGSCRACCNDADCDDGLWCNGEETCVDGVCQAGSAPLDPPDPEPDGVDKNRVISFLPGNPGESTAIRVKLVKMYDDTVCPARSGTAQDDLSIYEGEVRWAAEPHTYAQTEGMDETVDPSDLGLPHFKAAELKCEADAYYADWPALLAGEPLHLFGDSVLPCSTYDVQIVYESCQGSLGDEGNYSAPLTVQTGKFGDVVAPYYDDDPPPPPQPDMHDVNAVVDKFKGKTPPYKVETVLQPNVPKMQVKVGMLDVAKVVDAFVGKWYGEDGPGPCP